MVNHSFHFNRGLFMEGDTVYYRSPESRYSIRKAKVVKVEEQRHYLNKDFFIPYDVITLGNGKVLNASEAFVSRQMANDYLIKELKTLLVFQQVELENLKQKMAYEEMTLKRLEKGRF